MNKPCCIILHGRASIATLLLLQFILSTICSPTLAFASAPTTVNTPNNVLTASNTPTVVTNQKWVLKRRPQGVFDPQLDVQLISEPLDFANCGEDQLVVEVEMLSADAFVRTMLDEGAFHGSVPLNATIPAMGYGIVVRAGAKAKHKVGTQVQCMMGAQQYATVPSASAFQKKKPLPKMSPSSSMGLLGLTSGLTAYAGMNYVCQRPKKGETVVVTAAAGAVGSIAVQLAKARGARVIGIAGGPEKNKYLLKDLELDGVVDYKDTSRSIAEQLKETCPNGIDFVFDNVGGSILDELLLKINPKARIVICGAISQYSGNLNQGKVQGPSSYLKLAEKGATMKGFTVLEYVKKLPRAVFKLYWLYLRGKVKMNEHVEEGIESFPKALNHLFTGVSIGKCLVNVKQEEEQ